MKDIFTEGFQIGFKRYRNLKEYLCRSRLYDINVPRRNETRAATKGWRKCNRCTTCSRSTNLINFKSSTTGECFQISDTITCKDNNILYVVECLKCPSHPQYVGKSTRCLMIRGREHIGNVDRGNLEGLTTKGCSKMYQHFTTGGHSSSDMLIYGIEIVHGDAATCAVRERFWMNKLDTCRGHGLNTYRT